MKWCELWKLANNQPFCCCYNNLDVHYYPIAERDVYIEAFTKAGTNKSELAQVRPECSGQCMCGEVITEIDYFSNDPISPSICSCDLYSVIMVTGCQCGGK